MADRYWVGGAGTWDNASTTNWSATSGGASGASAPTSVDNVIFNTLSNGVAYAVTIGTSATALDITIANPATGAVTLTGTNPINCYGSWTNAAGVVFSFANSIVFLSATTGRTITTNAVNLGGINVITNQVGGGWTLVGSLTFGGILSVQAGTFDTGSYNVTCGIVQAIGTAVRAITLGTSTITLNNAAPWTFSDTTNLTFSGASSTIICNNAAPTFAGGGLTYGTVNLTSTSGGIVSFSGVNTFTTLNITSPTSNRKAVFIGNNMIVTGTLTLGAANAYNARIQVQSTNVGSVITLTVANINPLSDVDFRDITAAGASGTWSGTRLGNGLNNTNITFDAGKTVYWNLVAGGVWSANAWATSSGGAVATANFPLAQDTVIIDNTGLTASNTITIDASWWIGTLNVTRTNAWTFAFNGGPSIYRDVTLTSVTTVTGTAVPNFLGQGLTQTLTTNGVLLSMGINLTSVGGTLLLNGNLTTASTQTTTLNNGTLNLAGFTYSTGFFNSTNANTRAIAFGVGKIVVTGNNSNVINFDTSTNFSFTGSGDIEANYSGSVGSRNFIIGSTAGGSQTVAMNLNIIAGTDIVNIYVHWNNVNLTGFAGTFGNNGSKNFYGNLTLSTGLSLTGGANAFIFAATSGTKTITSNGKTFDCPVTFNGIGGTWQLQDAMTVGSTRTTTLTNGTLDLNNLTLSTGQFSSTNTNTRAIAFGLGKIILTALNTGVWNTQTATNFTITGTSRVEISGAGTGGQLRTVDAGAFGGTETNAPNFYVTAGADNVSFLGTGRKFGTVDFSNGGTSTFTGNFQSDNFSFFVYGNLILTASVAGFTTSSSFTGPITFGSTSGTKSVTSAGKTYPVPLTFDGIGGTWLCTDALTTSLALTLTNGTLKLAAGTTSTVGSFVTTGTNMKYLLSSVPTFQAQISDASGTNTVTYLTIQDNYATGGATWNATSATNVDAGNNYGWTFSSVSASSAQITMGLRSFTQFRG